MSDNLPAQLTLAEAKEEFGFGHPTLLRWKKFCPYLRRPLGIQKRKVAIGRGGRLELLTVCRTDLETIRGLLNPSKEGWIPLSEARILTGLSKITLERMGKRKRKIPGLNGPLQRTTFVQRVGKRKHLKPVEHFRREQIIALASARRQAAPRIPGHLFRDNEGEWCSPALATFLTGKDHKALWELGKTESCHFLDSRTWAKAAWPLARRPLRKKLFPNPGMGRKQIWGYAFDDCLSLADRLGKEHPTKETIQDLFTGGRNRQEQPDPAESRQQFFGSTGAPEKTKKPRNRGGRPKGKIDKDVTARNKEIEEALKQKKFPTIEAVAEHFDVDRRRVYEIKARINA
jgi:hypothetical protein